MADVTFCLYWMILLWILGSLLCLFYFLLSGLSTLDGDVSTDSGKRITSSLAIHVDGVSIVVVAYSSSMTSFFVGFVSNQ